MKNLINAQSPLNFKSKSKIAVALSTAILLSACGGTDQDEGTPTTTEQVFSGQAIDGYVARATVYLDTNNDATRNAWEAYAFTDNQGYFSYNPNTATDYCADTATAEQNQYCLKNVGVLDTAVLRIDGGYDVITGEPFQGQLSRRISAIPEAGVTETVLTPITSLLTGIESDTERATVLSALSIQESDLDIDYLNTDGAGTIDSSLLNTALKVHKVVSILSDRLTDTYDEIGEELGTPNDASSAIYTQLANQIVTSANDLDTVLANTDDLIHILDNAESELQEIYQRKDIFLPADIGSVDSPEYLNRAASVASSMSSVIDSLIIRDVSISDTTTLGSVRAIESLLIKSINERATDTSIDNAITFLTNQDRTLPDALIISLASANADIASLGVNDFTGDDFDSLEDLTAASTLATDAEPFTQLGGYTLKVSDLDLGFSPNNLDDKEVEFYFDGAATDTEGSFSACVKYIDEASSDGTLGEGNTRGDLVDGYWSLLGASETTTETYSALLTINFLGATYQAILKPVGNETIANIDYEKVRFDFDGDLNVYHSEDGLTDSTIVPTSAAQCQERLPSRIGL